MKRHHLYLASACLVLAAAALPAQEHLELGKMWTFEHPPLEYLEATYGFSPSQAWIDKTRLASVRLDQGCSGSFVSERGLILTNHHCVRDAVARVSPPSADWVKNGFTARSLAEEVKLPGFTISQLRAMTDVTEQMNAGISGQEDVATIAMKRDKNRDAILEKARTENPGLEPQVVSLYQGAMFHLYLYRVFNDIRLCLAPHLQTAHFGGDPDNFTYPRFGIDFALLRAWEDGKPANTAKEHFDFNAKGAEAEELVFVTGNPGTTKRLNTLAEVELARDVELPIQLELMEKRLEQFKLLAKRRPAIEPRIRPTILSLENSKKAYRGYLTGVQDERLIAQKREAEKKFKARVAADPELAKKYGDVWDKLARSAKELRRLLPLTRFYRPDYSQVLTRATAAVNAVDGSLDEKQRERHQRGALSPMRSLSPIDQEWLEFQLGMAQRWLPSDDPFIAALGKGKKPGDILAALRDGSRMDEDTFVQELLDQGAEAVGKSEDPAIKIARMLVPGMRKASEAVARVRAEQRVLAARIGRALFAVYGTKVPPDATFTLRLSDGVVRGFPYNGTIAPPWTSFYGLFARNCEFGNRYPFDLPQVWLDRKGKIDMTKPVNFVSTNDIIGGNSGSPVINRKHEVVGLVFDGNIEMLPNRYVYTDRVARCVSVHTAAIMEAITKIYDSPGLAAELSGKAGYK